MTSLSDGFSNSLGFVTIGAKSLESIRDFYKQVFQWTPIPKYSDIVVYPMKGFMLAFYNHQALALDANVKANNDETTYLEKVAYKGFTLALNMESVAAVDKAFERFESLGVEITRNPEKVFWGGYRGYIKDVESNLWEIVYNPNYGFVRL